MKPACFPALLFSTVLSISAPAQPAALKSGDYLAICGDSITEQKLYSAYLEEYLIACQPAAGLQASQFGWGGETSWGFLDRMENEVLISKPAAATLSYGMNDGDYSKTKPEGLARYSAALTAIVGKFKAAGVSTIVVGSPGAVDTTSFKGALFRPINAADYNQTLGDFAKAAREVATKEGVTFADLQGPMLDVMAKMKAKYGPDYFLAGEDGIHPHEAGHLVMAYGLLKALGCDGRIGTIEFDAQAGKTTASDGHKVLSSTHQSLELESTRYPFCFYGDPAKNNATTGVLEFMPFNQDLNRLMLVVKNPPATAQDIKVTWGTQSKTFTSAQLADGINLAAEFLINPFSEPFKNVHEAVLRQQRYETPMVKDMLHSLPDWKSHLAGKEIPYADFTKSLLTIDSALRQSASESVVPVRHTITLDF